MKVYLGGPINGCTDEEASGWRDDAKAILSQLSLDWIDPMDRDYRGREMEPGVAAEIVEKDKQDIRDADALLMNCPKPSVGTSMEVFYGYTLDKRIICVIPPGSIPSPWLVYHASAVVEGSILDAIKQNIP